MRQTIIHQTGKFMLKSYGNGLAWLFWNKKAGRELLVQGDDADRMIADLDSIERVHPNWSTDRTLSWLWDQCGWGDASEPFGQAEGRDRPAL